MPTQSRETAVDVAIQAIAAQDPQRAALALNPVLPSQRCRAGLWVFAWLLCLFLASSAGGYLGGRAVNESWVARLQEATRPQPQVQQESIGSTRPPTDAYSIWSKVTPTKQVELLRMLPDGRVLFHKEVTTDTASRVFWTQVAQQNPLAPKLEVSERQQHVLLQEIRELKAKLESPPTETAAKSRKSK